QPEHKESALTVTQSEPLLSDIQGMVLSVLSEACKAICAKEMELNKLDSGCGDGDCGTTLKRGAVEFQKWLASKKNVPLSANQITAHLAHVSESVMGGSSGALYSIFFLAAATELKNGRTLADVNRALGAGVTAISKYGGASVGDRTMLDPLAAIYSCLNESSGITTGEALQAAAKVCRK
ncbi:hypothetical protein BSL78_27835, partial [Apostichopus japonicus]